MATVQTLKKEIKKIQQHTQIGPEGHLYIRVSNSLLAPEDFENGLVVERGEKTSVLKIKVIK